MMTHGSKPSSLSKIPGDWEVVPLRKLAQVRGRVGWKGYKIEDLRESGPIVIGAKHIDDDNNLDLSDPTYLSREKYEESPEIFVEKNDIIYVQRGSLGKVAWINIDIGEATINPSIVLLKPLNNCAEYLYYFLCSDTIQKSIIEVKGATGVPMLSQKQISDFQITKPKSVTEQKAIAHILGLMDTAINKNNQLIAQKELQKKWLMQNILTGKKRLNGYNGKWKEIHIKDVSKEVSIRNKADNQLTVLSCTKYDGLVPSLEYFGRKIFSDDVSTYKVVPKNHFAYATNHIEEGSIGYQEILKEALISPMYTVFKTDSSINDPFFYKLLKSHKLVYQYQNRMEGSIDRRGGLRWDAFSIIKVQIPSYEEQSAIAKVLQIADKEIKLLKAKTEKLREQKKWLMQVLLTGKKRLKMNTNNS